MTDNHEQLIDMLTDIALGRYVEYGREGQYRYPVEVRVAAANCLLQHIGWVGLLTAISEIAGALLPPESADDQA